MAEDRLKEQIAAMVEKSLRSLEAAKSLFEANNFDFASSRAYYAVFYLLEALLLTKNLVYSKHAGVISGFSEHFIRHGVFPDEYAKLVSRLFRERHIGDYDFSRIITSEDARKDYDIANEIVETLRRYLYEQGYLQ